jgi:hypothetical protein
VPHSRQCSGEVLSEELRVQNVSVGGGGVGALERGALECFSWSALRGMSGADAKTAWAIAIWQWQMAKAKSLERCGVERRSVFRGPSWVVQRARRREAALEIAHLMFLSWKEQAMAVARG